MKFIAETALRKLLNLIKNKMDTKVDKETGKGLSTNDYTTDEKTKLSGIEVEANKYILPVAGETLGGIKSGTGITVDGLGNVSINDDSHNHIISNVDGLQTALDGKAASDHTHNYAGSDSAGGPANAIKNGIVTRAKLAQDTLYSPNDYKTENFSLSASDIGKTIVSNVESVLLVTLTQEASSTMPIGSEIALFWFLGTGLTLQASGGIRFVIPEKGVFTNGALKLAELYTLAAIKKITTDAANGDIWTIQGNVEVVT